MHLMASVVVSSRQYFSSQHLWSSYDSARRCAALEAELLGVAHYTVEHRTLAMNAVMSAVAFLEGLANEAFQDAADKDSGQHVSPRIEPLSAADVARLSEFWGASKQGEKYVSVLDKFQMALLLCERERFAKGENPYQDAHYLVELRNDLTHARPVSQEHGVPDKKRQDGIATRFADNQLMVEATQNPWYPDKCLGAGCAQWAADSARKLAEAWCDRLGLEPYFIQEAEVDGRASD